MSLGALHPKVGCKALRLFSLPKWDREDIEKKHHRPSDQHRKSRRDSPLEVGDRVVFAARKWRGGRCLTEDTPGTITAIDAYGTATIALADGTEKFFTLAQLAYEPSEQDIERRKAVEQETWSDEEREKRNVNKNPVSDLPTWGHDRRRKGEQFGNL